MGITEQDYLLVRDRDNARTWMLLKSERQFHLVRVDASLTEQKYERLMKRYPCGMKTFQELGIAVTPLDREKCTHAIFEGTKEGDGLTLWFSGDVRRYRLGDSYPKERLAAFFDTQQRRWDIPAEPEGPPEQTARAIAWTLNILSFLMVLTTAFGRRLPWGWLRWVCLIAFVLSVGLCLVWPGRFAAEDRRKLHKTQRVYRADLEFAVICLPLVLVADHLGTVIYRNELTLFLIGAAVGVVTALALLWRSREYRSGGASLLIFLLLVSGGPVAQVNQLLDFGPTTAYMLTVDETTRDRHFRAGTSYDCHVTMPDGERVQFEITRSQFEAMSPGDPITVVVHDGALGLEYLTIDWEA